LKLSFTAAAAVAAINKKKGLIMASAVPRSTIRWSIARETIHSGGGGGGSNTPLSVMAKIQTETIHDGGTNTQTKERIVL
jgi:hypothetical protein